MSVARFASTAVSRIKHAFAALFSRHLPENGSVGMHDVAHNVRILFVNGIGYTKPMCEYAASRISKLFNDSKVYYSFCPISLFQVIKTIAKIDQPRSSPHLLSTIRHHLHEIEAAPSTKPDAERTQARARLVIIAHSAGGALLNSLRTSLCAEERRQISVITFGSASVVKQSSGFFKVSNYVAFGDIVPRISYVFKRICSTISHIIKKRKLSDRQTSLLSDPSKPQNIFQKIMGSIFATARQLGSMYCPMVFCAEKIFAIARSLFEHLPQTTYIPPAGDWPLFCHDIHSWSYQRALLQHKESPCN